MARPKTIEEHINLAINTWGFKDLSSFMDDIIPLVQLFDFDKNNDWLLKDLIPEDRNNVRLIRSMYIISKIAENHAGNLVKFKATLPKLYLKLEEAVKSISAQDHAPSSEPTQLDLFS